MFVMWKILLDFRKRWGLMNLRNMGRSRFKDNQGSRSLISVSSLALVLKQQIMFSFHTRFEDTWSGQSDVKLGLSVCWFHWSKFWWRNPSYCDDASSTGWAAVDVQKDQRQPLTQRRCVISHKIHISQPHRCHNLRIRKSRCFGQYMIYV